MKNLVSGKFVQAVYLLIVLINSVAFAATDGEWKPGLDLLNFYDNKLSTLFILDMDGDGPQPEKAIIVYSDYVDYDWYYQLVIWDGENWQKLGSGIKGFIEVVTIYDNHLVIGGCFDKAGEKSAKNIAQWNGSEWQPLGSGFNSTVTSLIVYKNQLIAGGIFSKSGDIATNNVAKWNGITWQPLGEGTNGSVRELAIYKENLIAGGSFTKAGSTDANFIAQWNGDKWQSLGNTWNKSVNTFAIYNDELIVGGGFSAWAFSGTNNVNRNTNSIARWDGANWKYVGEGIEGFVYALSVYQNKLVAAGQFVTAGHVTAISIAQWDGNDWQPLGKGIERGGFSYINKLLVYKDKLIAKGHFSSIGEINVKGMAAWDGTNWQPFPIGNSIKYQIHTFAVYKDELIAGGMINRASGIDVNSIARWSGNGWLPLGKGIKDELEVLTVYNDELIAAGTIRKAGDVDVNGIARWNGSQWLPLGKGLDSTIKTLAVYNNNLIAAGDFDTVNGVDLNYVAKWDGSTWQPLGSGLGLEGNWGGAYPAALTVYNGHLIVAGYFNKAGNKDVNNIAQWNGEEWQPLGSGLNGSIISMQVFNGKLYVAGYFNKFGENNVGDVAYWDESNWHFLNLNLIGEYPSISSLAVYENKLIVAGNFKKIAGIDSNNIASWDGKFWKPFGNGIMDGVRALTVYKNSLIAGGSFYDDDKGEYAWTRWVPNNLKPDACIINDSIIEAEGDWGAKVSLNGSCSSDEDSSPGTNDDINDFNWFRYTAEDSNKIFIGSGEIIDCNLPLGENKIILEVIDKAGDSDSNEITITIQDTRPPCFRFSVSPNILWPANHKMVKVTPNWSVKDICDAEPEVSLVSITCNDNAATDDIVINKNGSIYLRAEKGNKVKDRIYYLTYKAADFSGNTTTRTATVTIPHDKGK